MLGAFDQREDMLCQEAVCHEEYRDRAHETKCQTLPGEPHGERKEQDEHVHQPEAQGRQQHHQQHPTPHQVVMTRHLEVAVRQVDIQSERGNRDKETRIRCQHAIDTIVEGGEEWCGQREHDNADQHRQLRYHPIIERVGNYLPRRHYPSAVKRFCSISFSLMGMSMSTGIWRMLLMPIKSFLPSA